jgi:NAD(P)-dependent dehydrogenase (short-subunit alcohol dehydrogenase family)
MSGKRIFITGGASGLGRALAESYARAGWRVCIGDLDLERCAGTMGALAGPGPHHAIVCDVTKDRDVEAAAAWLEREWGGLDVLVNNAGVAQVGAIADVSIEDWKWAIDINLLGVVRGCKTFVPLFRRQKQGHIVNVASMAGLMHPPRSAAYSATKAAVVALSEVLKAELVRDHIQVSVVCPGFFRTQLAANMRASDPKSVLNTHKLVEGSPFSAEQIAEKVQRGIARGEFHILTHREEYVSWLMKRFLPFDLYLKAMKRQVKSQQQRR